MTQGQRIEGSCVPQVPVDMMRLDYLPPRNIIPMHVYEKYVNTRIGSHPDEVARWDQRIASRQRCIQRDATTTTDLMAYPDNTCIGERDAYHHTDNDEMTAEDSPWCAVNTCTSDAYINSIKARYANFRIVPDVGQRMFLPVSLQASQQRDQDSPIWNPIFVRPGENTGSDDEFRQIYLKQRSNPDNAYQVRVENQAEFIFYGENTRRTGPPTPEVAGGPPTSGNWKGPRGLTFVSVDDDVIEGVDTFINNPRSPLTLKDWAVVEIPSRGRLLGSQSKCG